MGTMAGFSRRDSLKRLSLGDSKTLQDAHRAYVDSNGSMKALVVSLMQSDSFLYRAR